MFPNNIEYQLGCPEFGNKINSSTSCFRVRQSIYMASGNVTDIHLSIISASDHKRMIKWTHTKW